VPARSLRTSLTLWNVATLVGLLAIFAGALILINQNRLMAGLDNQLRDMGDGAARSGPDAGPRPEAPFPPGRAPEPGLGPGQGFGMGPDMEGPGPGGLGPGGPPPMEAPPPPPNPMSDYRLVANYRRPRFFGLDGGSLASPEDVPMDPVGLRSALGGKIGWASVKVEGEPIRVYSAPMIRQGHIVGAVQIGRELRDLDLLWVAQGRTLLAMLPIAVAVAGLGAYWLTNRALRPVASMTRDAASISHSDLSRRLAVQGEDEFAQLAQTFNGMLARLEESFGRLEGAYADLERSFEQQRRFTADASHELRTPLTRLRLATSSALEGAKTPEEFRAALVVADKAAETMSRLVQQLLTLATLDAGVLPLRLETTDLRIVAAEAIDAVGNPRVETDFAEVPLPIRGDEEHLKRVFQNLVENALRYTPETGRVRLSVGRQGTEVFVAVADTGEGISEQHLPHIFERFYRVDAARARADGGCGLGLAIAKDLIATHGGRMTVESKQGQGSVFRVFLPIAGREPGTQISSS